ncbi:hypothetical protein B0H16DRAFT_1686003 [Mycena metata]|uniref:Uncharacterized protein n=1 Tax=Mycena metata TaxID=1033252 RepID=A0AAD7JUN1_9AGAR|nr:hypothetical protein B0H16DRAFT_1686003 [Mycena metata]
MLESPPNEFDLLSLMGIVECSAVEVAILQEGYAVEGCNLSDVAWGWWAGGSNQKLAVAEDQSKTAELPNDSSRPLENPEIRAGSLALLGWRRMAGGKAAGGRGGCFRSRAKGDDAAAYEGRRIAGESPSLSSTATVRTSDLSAPNRTGPSSILYLATHSDLLLFVPESRLRVYEGHVSNSSCSTTRFALNSGGHNRRWRVWEVWVRPKITIAFVFKNCGERKMSRAGEDRDVGAESLVVIISVFTSGPEQAASSMPLPRSCSGEFESGAGGTEYPKRQGVIEF